MNNNTDTSQQIETTSRGGRQSKLEYMATCLPPLAILAISEVLYIGLKRYGRNNWRNIDIDDHINHALVHIFKYMAADDVVSGEEHLRHAATRLLFALELDEEQKRCVR